MQFHHFENHSTQFKFYCVVTLCRTHRNMMHFTASFKSLYLVISVKIHDNLTQIATYIDVKKHMNFNQER